jgi:hypothetical protein
LLTNHIHAFRALGHAIGDEAEKRLVSGRRPTELESLARTVLVDLSSAYLKAAADLEQMQLQRIDQVGPLAYPRMEG